MKKEKYIVEIEMPDKDSASSSWVCDVLQSDADIEDEDRWKVSVKEHWKPSEEQLEVMKKAVAYFGDSWVSKEQKLLESLYEQLKAL